MDKIKSFQDLKVWQDAQLFTVTIYKLTADFPERERFGLVDQLRRSASSIGANIAEGFGRYHYKEKMKFYFNARGSTVESQNHILLARDLDYLSGKDAEKLLENASEILRELNGLIRATGRNSNV